MTNTAAQMDLDFMFRAVALAQVSEQRGNLPIGAIIVEGGAVIAEGENTVLCPDFHPGRHAEINALNKISGSYLHQKSKHMTIYTTQEPCVMCLGSIVLHRIGRVVFGGYDPNRGASYLLPYLERIYPKQSLPEVIGPILPDVCDELFSRANEIYRNFRDKPSSL